MCSFNLVPNLYFSHYRSSNYSPIGCFWTLCSLYFVSEVTQKIPCFAKRKHDWLVGVACYSDAPKREYKNALSKPHSRPSCWLCVPFIVSLQFNSLIKCSRSHLQFCTKCCGAKLLRQTWWRSRQSGAFTAYAAALLLLVCFIGPSGHRISSVLGRLPFGKPACWVCTSSSAIWKVLHFNGVPMVRFVQRWEEHFFVGCLFVGHLQLWVNKFC